MSQSHGKVEEFGQELINARNYKKISLEQISDITKIALPYLEAMEQGRWDVLPQPYMEVFLKAYAETVGMNVPKVMKKYKEMVLSEIVDKPEETETAHAPITHEVSEEASQTFFESRQNLIFIGIGAVLIVATVLLFSFFNKGTEGESGPQAGDQIRQGTQQTTGPAPEEIVSDQPRDVVSQEQSVTNNQTQQDQRFSIRLNAREMCWVQATIDSNNVRDMLLRNGENVTLSADKEIHLVIGNAGGISLEYKDTVMDTVGPDKKPVTLVFGPDGLVSQRMGAWRLDFSGVIDSVRTTSEMEEAE